MRILSTTMNLMVALTCFSMALTAHATATEPGKPMSGSPPAVLVTEPTPAMHHHAHSFAEPIDTKGLLTEREMKILIGGEGCFGIGSKNCCTEVGVLLAITSYASAIVPNPYFSLGILVGTIHRTVFC